MILRESDSQGSERSGIRIVAAGVLIAKAASGFAFEFLTSDADRQGADLRRLFKAVIPEENRFIKAQKIGRLRLFVRIIWWFSHTDRQ